MAIYYFLLKKNKFIEMKQFNSTPKSSIKKISEENDLIQTIKTYIIDVKPFLQIDFQIIHLVQYFNLPTHQCTSLINNLLGKYFRDWINTYGIEYFIETYL